MTNVSPPHLTAHSTRSLALSGAFVVQVPVLDICNTVTWSSIHKFTTHYAVMQQTRSVATFRQVLQSVSIWTTDPTSWLMAWESPYMGMNMSKQLKKKWLLNFPYLFFFKMCFSCPSQNPSTGPPAPLLKWPSRRDRGGYRAAAAYILCHEGATPGGTRANMTHTTIKKIPAWEWTWRTSVTERLATVFMVLSKVCNWILT